MSEPESLACELESASSEYHQKNFSALEIRLDRILSANPRNAEALHLLGCMHKDKGDLDRAIELIQASVDNDASNPLSLLNLGKLLNLKGEYHLSAPILHESLRLNPNIVETWFCYGNSLMKVDPSHSIRIFRHVLKLNYKHLGASLNLGALLTRFNRIEEAKQVFSDACMIYPRNTKLRIGFARLFAQIQQHNLAFIQLSYCIDQDLTDEEILAFSLEQLSCIGKKEDHRVLQNSLRIKYQIP